MRISKKGLLLVLLSLSTIVYSQAREDVEFDENDVENASFFNRLYTGGNVSFNIFNNTTYFDISPIIGYRVTNEFSAGVGLKYIYIGSNQQPRFSTSMYGGSLFARYLFFENFIAHTEFEMINLELSDPLTAEVSREWVPLALVGGGYRSNIGGRSYIQIMLLYDIIGDERNPYRFSSPFGQNSNLYIRGGITIGI